MATREIIIPQGTDGNFQFQIELDGEIFTLLFQFNRRADIWFFDLLQQDGTPIRRSIKLTTAFFWLRQVKRTPRPDGDLFALDTTQQGIRATLDELNNRILFIYEEAPVP